MKARSPGHQWSSIKTADLYTARHATAQDTAFYPRATAQDTAFLRSWGAGSKMNKTLRAELEGAGENVVNITYGAISGGCQYVY